ncbi:MAG TPA: putative Ig domain-containing protein, partial [Planctomycetota bacterium]|nr:putative Ig domain-containing protein [Planctomycetota bacterium]
IDRAPVLVSPGNKNANEGQALVFTLSASDPESDPINYSLVGTPTGSAFNSVSGLFAWTPNYIQAGSYPVTFTARSTIFSDTQAITITVNNVNGPPVLTSPGNKNVNVNELLAFTLSASDPDGDAIAYSMVGTPTGATLNPVSGVFSWTPNYTQTQDCMIFFSATANGGTDSESIIITVESAFDSGSSGTSSTSSGSSGQGKGGMCGLLGPEAFLLIILMMLFRSVYRRQALR